jgi:hypothetical protein
LIANDEQESALEVAVIGESLWRMPHALRIDPTEALRAI